MFTDYSSVFWSKNLTQIILAVAKNRRAPARETRISVAYWYSVVVVFLGVTQNDLFSYSTLSGHLWDSTLTAN